MELPECLGVFGFNLRALLIVCLLELKLSVLWSGTDFDKVTAGPVTSGVAVVHL